MRNFLMGALLFAWSGLIQGADFNQYFRDQALRIDFVHSGTDTSSAISLFRITRLAAWAGSQQNLIDTFEYGTSMIRVYDGKSGLLIYSRGFSGLFDEWKTTEEAKVINRAFQESLLIPLPLDTVRIEILERKKDLTFRPLFDLTLGPGDKRIVCDRPASWPVEQVVHSGNPDQKVDLVFIPEGYTASEMDKFRKDVKRFSDSLFNWSPFNRLKDLFNISLVAAPSEESGTDIPGNDIWKRTLLSSHFYTFGTERYLSVDGIWKMHETAEAVPYDQICVLVNTDKYGGGGFFNFSTVCTADNRSSIFVFCHELGHAFAGLGDEYYDSEVAYQGFYNRAVEPWEPNLTTLVHFEKKWKSMLTPGTLVPTPVNAQNRQKVGVYEGGGYVTKGVYRPWIDCSMRSVKTNGFCPVCQKAISDMAHFYAY